MKLVLKSVGNPDSGQSPYQPQFTSEPEAVVEVRNFKEASLRCREFINSNELGSSNWAGGQVFYNKKLVAEVAFNGRVWTPGRKQVEIKF